MAKAKRERAQIKKQVLTPMATPTRIIVHPVRSWWKPDWTVGQTGSYVLLLLIALTGLLYALNGGRGHLLAELAGYAAYAVLAWLLLRGAWRRMHS